MKVLRVYLVKEVVQGSGTGRREDLGSEKTGAICENVSP